MILPSCHFIHFIHEETGKTFTRVETEQQSLESRQATTIKSTPAVNWQSKRQNVVSFVLVIHLVSAHILSTALFLLFLLSKQHIRCMQMCIVFQCLPNNVFFSFSFGFVPFLSCLFFLLDLVHFVCGKKNGVGFMTTCYAPREREGEREWEKERERKHKS